MSWKSWNFLPEHIKAVALFLAVIIIASFAVYVSASGEPEIALVSPDDGKVFNTTNSINFLCNATNGTADKYMHKLDLYTNINGTFSKTNTSCFGELCEDSSTMLLMHFNNNSIVGENDTFVYDWSGNGNNAIYTSSVGSTYNASGGIFSGAFEFNGLAQQYVEISDSNTLDLASTGTIEFWIYPIDTSIDAYILTKAPASSCTASAYAIILTQGYIEIDFGSNNDEYTYVADTLPPIETYQWSHVAVTWNSSGVLIYVNNASSGEYILSNDNNGYGSRGTENQHYAPNFITNNNDLWIGAPDPSCKPSAIYYGATSYFYGRIDELALYNRMLSVEEVSEHYGRSSVLNATKNWSESNVPDGTYIWNCKAQDNELQSGWNALNRTFYVDMSSAPEIHSITSSPNSTDDLDPNIQINVTANITDVSGVSSVILQYKNPNEGFFRNATMAYDGGSKTYNGTFTPPLADNGVWVYRIWSNDTVGHSGISSETNISVEFDRTWTLSVIDISGSNASGFGTLSALNGTAVKIGTIIINNTGDTLLRFDLSYSPTSPDIQMSYNISEPIDIDTKNAASFNITAISPQQIYEWPIQLIINASTALATPTGAVVSGTLVPFRGGPYLEASIQNYQPTVSHGQIINLSAKAKNLGNETATNVWFNWTLPTGWNVTAGNKSENFASVPNGSTVWNNITVIVSTTTATLGTFENGIVAIAESDENITGTDSKTVSVVCKNSDGVCGNGCAYTSDNDCAQPSSSTGSSSGSSTSTSTTSSVERVESIYVLKYSILIDTPKRVDTYRGNTVKFNISAYNSEPGTLIDDIIFSIQGYPETHISLNPQKIEELAYNKTGQSEVSIDIPNYTKYGEYDLTILANGIGTNDKSKNTSLVQASGTVRFVVHSAFENETLAGVSSAEELLKSMVSSNIGTKKTTPLLEEARRAISDWDYDLAKELAEKIIETGNTAIKSHALIKQAEMMLNEAETYGVDARQTSKLYALAKAAFEREDYARAAQRANDAVLTGAIETTGRVTMIRTLNENSGRLTAIILFLLLSSIIISRQIRERAITEKIRRLDKEEKSLKSLEESANKEYYKEKAMGKSEYYKTMYEYEKRKNEIKKEKNALAIKLIRLKKPVNARSMFLKEEARLNAEIMEEQKKYFEEGAISKDKYKSSMNELKDELAEIKMNVEAAGNFIKKGKTALIIAIVCYAVFLPLASALNTTAGNDYSAGQAILEAQNYISEMQNAKLGIQQANDTLNEAKILYARKDYLGAEQLAKYVETIKKTAIETSAMMDDVEEQIYDAEAEGINVSLAKESFAAGVAANDAEDYVFAEKMLSKAINDVDDARERAAIQAAMKKSMLSSAIEFIKAEKKTIAIMIVAIIAASIIARSTAKAANARNRIKEITREIESANRMIADAQKKYYRGGTISKSDYEVSIQKYRQKMLAAKRELAVLQKMPKKTEKSEVK